ncbi:MAG: peptide deformylase [Phycisphaeraceae bacterium]|nr:peptide deformylase [Phycisphaeraceae bacterium]
MKEIATRKIVLYPAPVLRRKAMSVATVDDSIRALVEDMFRVMRDEEGAGLAAPQVGESLRIFVTEARPDEREEAGVYINPIVEKAEGELDSMNEGCLSLPEIRGDIRRPLSVTLSWSDLDGVRHQRTHSGMLARVWQHECDHLDGVLIIDRMAPADRLRARKPLKALERDAAQ